MKLLNRLPFLILLICPVVILLSACSTEPQPSEKDIERALTFELPSAARVSRFSVEAMQNIGTSVEPEWQARFRTMIQLTADTFVHDGAESEVTFVRRVRREGTSVEIFGRSVSRLFAGAWETTLEFDGNPIQALGLPESAFGPNQVIIRGTTAEADYYAQLEQKRLRALEEERLAEERAAEEKRRAEARAEAERRRVLEQQRLAEERAAEARRQMLADAPRLIVGTWRWDGDLATYRSDGTATHVYDNGSTSKTHWNVDGDILTLAFIEVNGKPYQDNNPYRYQILDVTSSKFLIADLSSLYRGRQQQATRVN